MPLRCVLHCVAEGWITEQLTDTFEGIAEPELDLFLHRIPVKIFDISGQLDQFALPINAIWQGVDVSQQIVFGLIGRMCAIPDLSWCRMVQITQFCTQMRRKKSTHDGEPEEFICLGMSDVFDKPLHQLPLILIRKRPIYRVALLEDFFVTDALEPCW